MMMKYEYLKSYPKIFLRAPVHDLLGYFFGVGRYIGRVLPVLEAAGRDTMRLPDPRRKRGKQLPELLNDIPELGLIIDSFEQKVQKPREQAEVDSYYSSKKKRTCQKPNRRSS